MLPFQIKICGITRPNDALNACESGADAIGLNFYAPSPRFVDTAQAQLIAQTVDTFNDEHRDLAMIRKIGVFVNSTSVCIAETAILHRLDGIQFHGDEQPEQLEEVRDLLTSWKSDVSFVRAVRVDKTKNESEPSRIVNRIQAWTTIGVDAILLDAAAPGEFGGTGEALDWTSVPRFLEFADIILAGGLKPENVSQAIDTSQVQSVDVASGVESEPGIKDHVKVSEFVRQARTRISSLGKGE
ncbi:MAG: phosphoribosylanthranilate isomerase [Mariniblastus sp.]|jgi:phosphoribosylanthranilate isomerase